MNTTEIVKETPWEEIIQKIIGSTTNLDFYRLVAAFFYEKNPEDVTTEERETTKMFLYSTKYRRIDEIVTCMDSFAIPRSIIEQIRNERRD